MMIQKNRLKKLLKRLLIPKFKKSYAQGGEDMILSILFAHIKHGFYVDVGANDPYFQSNTQFFYENYWHGINIDANFESIKKLKSKRKRDVNIEALIGDTNEELEYYYFEQSAYNGCVKNDNIPSKLLYSKKIKVTSLTTLLLERNIKEINFLSVDAEGFDLNVLQSLDLTVIRPQAIVVESFSKDLISDLSSDISIYLKKSNYVYYCRSASNSIYLSNEFHAIRFKNIE
jgi:FkbM family methyltransferase